MAGTHSEMCGMAPEAAQAMVRAEMARHAAEMAAAGTPIHEAQAPETPAQDPSIEWYYLEDNRPIGPVNTADLQAYILEHGATKVCPKGQAAWSEAIEHGFKLPEVAESFGVPVVEPVISLGDTTDPKEEVLETLPDSDLQALALEHKVILKFTDYSRSHAVKELARLGVTP